MPGIPNEDRVVREWRNLLRRYATASCAVDGLLHERHGLGVSEFEILDRLTEADHDKLRMQEIGELVHLTQSALSRAVARLEREHLVERLTCPEDRRGVHVRLTDAGRERHAAALPTHRAVLADQLGS